jgi:prepilin-type N-terminal cleavage/methylation domain-containing protein
MTRTAFLSRRHAVRAFTLVELLVVIGIIALLIALLLPTLKKAQQAAQNAQCLSNLRQIGQAVTMYRADTGRIPFFWILRNNGWQPVPQNGTGNTLWWTAFSQGGRTTHPSITIGYMDDKDKPLNKYLYKDIYPSTWDGTKAAAQQRDPREVFRCPADDGASGMANAGVGVPLNYLGTSVPSPYDLYGTDYMCNRGWMYDKEIIQLYYKIFPTSAGMTHAKVDHFNRGISKIASKWIASEVYVAADLQFIWSIFYHVEVPGAHTSQPLHNGVFLDGHAKHVYITKRDINSWGARIPGRYLPKYGEGWRDARAPETGYFDQSPTQGSKGIPWSGFDPFGIGPRTSSTFNQ